MAMAASLLLNQMADEFGGDTLNRIASTIGESPGKIKTALSAMLPALLGGLASKAQTRQGAHELLDTIHHLDTPQYEHVADAVKTPGALGNLMNTGGPLLESVLPGKSGAVNDWVASRAGIPSTSSKSLMSMVLPLVLGLLGRRVGSSGESGLTSMLGKPSNFLQDAPSGLAGVLGIGGAAAGSAGAAVNEIGQHGRAQVMAAEAAPAWRRWLWPLLLLLALIALLGYFMRNQRVQAPAVPNPPQTAGEANLGALVSMQLPNGVTLRVPANGVESRLVAFIQDKNSQAGPDTWFSLDRLEFETDSATLRPSSQEQLRNVAEIMKAYPQVKVKFGGYTDNTGNPQQNQQLSAQRATSAMGQVVTFGVDASRLSSEGYGEQHPVADNATAEGRQRNRRVDINVTAK